MIRTDRLTLRLARPDDLEALHEAFSDPRAMRYWSGPAHHDIAQTERILRTLIHPDPGKQEEYVLDYRGRCIGKAGVWDKPEVGYMVVPAFWGRGFAFEALSAILPRAFGRWPDQAHLTAELDPRNAASARLLEKLGFVCTGVVEKNFLYGGVEWTDTAYYRLDRPDRPDRPSANSL
ncbi:GNAT family N-acetyltransferase [Sagittula stellata]|uniref:Acetyltransferase, GNAT family protein n=1 Tax=Sagittula stellata (strain ATCC 700073 / DSM 11524 / E-37) TaxID=388399 RepID=A3K653_SAGS3|nr:GNAT family N-acetyltransferase [Sagittula stellata]EBA07203.1 acetyltransferase, GNAT family protein [Sagittula stellata E-37]